MKTMIKNMLLSTALWWLSVSCLEPSRVKDAGDPMANESSNSGLAAPPAIQQQEKATPIGKLFTIADAERIIGQPVHLTDSSTRVEENVIRHHCTYFANTIDSASGKTGAVYLLAEQYNSVSLAQKKYSHIKSSNEDHDGVKVLNDLGDEAYFHSDGENFCFVMIRKDARVFTMKVNKLTSKTSLEEFNAIAKNIAKFL